MKSNKIRMVLTICCAMVLSACTSMATQTVSDSRGLTLLHLNDTYRIDAVEDGTAGGFSRVVTLIRDLQAQGRDVRLTHGGDFLFPSLESQLWAGRQMVEAMNFMDDLAPLYVVPGNHEFDSRQAEVIVARIRESRFDWLADNLTLATGEPDVDRRLRNTFSFQSGNHTIGVFAITLLPEHGGNVRDYTNFERDYLAPAERTIAALERAGADLIIGLTHLHLADDLRLATLKEQHPSFRLVVGGHEHEPEFQAETIASAAVMKGASNAREIWRIDVDFTADGTEIRQTQLALDETIPNDAGYDVVASKYRAQLLELIPFLESRVGAAAVRFDAREVTVRNGDSNWGMFIADQMRGAFGDPPADLAFINGGTLRLDDYVAGDITFEDIGRTFGFSSMLRRMKIRGDDFRELLEAGYRGIGPSKGYFPQLSGFRVCVDRRQPDGQRILQLQLPDGDAWSEIDSDEIYSLVASDYVYGGGDGYDFHAVSDVSPPGSELKYLVLDAIIRAQAAGEKVGDNVAGPRYVELPPGQERCFN